MNKSESITELAKALVKFHSVMGKVSKDAKNPFFKNNYASLSNIIEAVTKPLNDNGLSVLQLPSIEGLTTLLLHESGEWISSVSATPVKDATDPQKLGSAITYARRYALGAILSLNIDEDDDGQKANKPARQQAPTPLKKPISAKPTEKKVIVFGTPQFDQVVEWIMGDGTIELAKKHYSISEEVEDAIKKVLQVKEIG
tara:strand:+ start:200 stop:796 length:597 start_codon:yes stop_codon:yes gene_type:complete